MKAYINAGKLSAGHARVLVGQPDPEAVAREIVEKGLNVRQVEAMARRSRPKRRPRKKTAPAARGQGRRHAWRWRSGCPMRSGLLVSIDHRGKGGVLLQCAIARSSSSTTWSGGW